MLIFKVVLFVVFAGLCALLVLSAFQDVVVGEPPRQHKERKITRPFRVGVAAVLMAAFLVGLNGFGQVPAGHRGVVLRFGAVTGTVLDEGLYLITPGITSVELMDVQVHAHRAKATAASKDLQDVSTEMTLNYRLDPSKVDETYRELRKDYEARIIVPAIQEAVKAATAAYNAESLVQERPVVRNDMETSVTDRLAKHGIIVDMVSITDFAFSKEFSDAIEQKVVAAQTALRARNDLDRIKTEAEQRVATAKAEAEAIRIQAEAIMSQGGAAYVNLKAIEKWDGKLPTWTGGGALPFINVNNPPSLADARK